MSAVRGYAEVAADLRKQLSVHGYTSAQGQRWDDVRREAAVLLAAVAATLPDCPRCGGTGDLLDLICDNCGCSASLPLGVTCSNHLAKPSPCPDCTDGKVPVAQLAAVWEAVHDENVIVVNFIESPRQMLDHLRSVRPAPSPKEET